MKKIEIIDILKTCNHISFVSGNSSIVCNVVSLNDAGNNHEDLCWCNDKNLPKLKDIHKGTIIIGKSILENQSLIQPECNYIIVDNPRNSFRQILAQFFVETRGAGISSKSTIHASVKIGKNVFIGDNVVIEEGCIIGDNCEILHNSTILKSTIIGKNVKIGCNCTIGGTGFGYEKDENGEFQLIPHLGNVVLEDYVEIGNNTCIDRAVLGSTILEENVKVDNLVHIAHGVKVMRNSVVIANAMVAGSVVIGENSWISPSVSILNQKKVGSNALVGLGAVVLKDVEDNDVIVGNPGKSIRNK